MNASDFPWPVHATVDGPLAQWAASRPDAPALVEAEACFSFAALDAEVVRRASEHALARSPRVVLVEGGHSTARRLIDFLAVVRSGRCAAVADAHWPSGVRDRVREDLPVVPHEAAPAGAESSFYVGYTSGSTGRPKGFVRSHRSWVESFRACIEAFGPATRQPVLAPGQISHSLFLFGMMLGLWTGGGVVVQPRFSAARALASLRDGQASCLVAVPSQLIMMLQVAQRRSLAPIDAVSLIMISGARWMRQHTEALRRLFPNARIVEFYGASETSFIAWMDADENAPADSVGRPFPQVQLEIRHRPAARQAGMIFVRSPMLFTGYVDSREDATAAVREGEWLSVRDMGDLDSSGCLRLAGRQNRMVVTSGKNLFPEEVEAVLASFPHIEAAFVQGVPDAVRGTCVVALLKIDAGHSAAPAAADIAEWCRGRLDSYKVPRRFLACDDWPLTQSGKTDHFLLGARVHEWFAATQSRSDEGIACLRPLP